MSQPGNEKTFRTITLEEHFATPEFMEGPGHDMSDHVRSNKGQSPLAFINAHLVEQLLDLGDLRIADMDAAGIDMQVLSLNSPGLEQRFRAAVRSSLGAGWCPLLQVHSPSRHEFTGIFVSGSQSDYRVILATLEAHEATLVELHVGPREMLSWLTEPGKQRRHKGGGADHEDKDEDRDQQ